MNMPKRASRHHFMRRSWVGPNSRCHARTTGSLVVEDCFGTDGSAANDGSPRKPMSIAAARRFNWRCVALIVWLEFSIGWGGGRSYYLTPTARSRTDALQDRVRPASPP